MDLPMNESNYYDEDTNQFPDNVLGTEVYESLVRLDARFDGPIEPVYIAAYPAEFLLDEVSINQNTAAALRVR